MRESLKKLFAFFLFSICFIAIIIGIYYFFYYKELREIKSQLKEIENVEVLNVWGSDDVNLEEISARLKIKNKFEIVLVGLSKDVNQYPKSIRISEINGYSFTTYNCHKTIGIGYSIDIGSESNIGKLIGIKMNNPKDVVENIEKIIVVIEKLKKYPELNYFENKYSENYLSIRKLKKEDKDAMNNLFDVEKEFKFAEKWKWKNKKCCNE